MRAVGWHNGSNPDEPAGYGIKLSPSDRDRHFDRTWSEVVLELEGGEAATVSLSGSFWRSCSELRSADLGRWLLAEGVAPWRAGAPPAIAVNRVDGNRFTARVLRSRALL